MLKMHSSYLFFPEEESRKIISARNLKKDSPKKVLCSNKRKMFFPRKIIKRKVSGFNFDEAERMRKAEASKHDKYPDVFEKDMLCLAWNEKLNDTIIEFYLKYIFHVLLTAEIREKTYIFTSFFWRKFEDFMADKADASPEKWIRKIDLYKTDFIIIPYHLPHYSHWFLVIVCYLSKLSKPIQVDDESEVSTSTGYHQQQRSSKFVERPCICTFDSVQCPDAMVYKEKAVSNVKTVLYNNLKQRYGDSRITRRTLDLPVFNSIGLPQKNKNDCGLFLLQYAESFFEQIQLSKAKSKRRTAKSAKIRAALGQAGGSQEGAQKPSILKFQQPFDVRHWFTHERIFGKREEIEKVICETTYIKRHGY